MILHSQNLLTPRGDLSPGWVRCDGPVIVDTGAGDLPSGVRPSEVVELGSPILSPGFVDQHCHGGGTYAFTDGPDAARAAARSHLRHGTTSVMASLVTDSLENLRRQMDALAPLVDADEVLGIHLEGPWLSEHHCGAHDPALLRDPDPDEVRDLLTASDGRVRMVTYAAERPGGDQVAHVIAELGAVGALGHSHATYAEACSAIADGARVATHLYNAERPFHHREPGLITALLEDERVTIELIADGVHVHPAALRSAFRAAPGRYVLVTDAMAAAAAADGTYQLGPLQVTVADGVARLANGTIAGSTLTMDAAVRFVVRECGSTVAEALQAATRRPADAFGRTDLGRIEPGAQADFVVLSDGLDVQRVMRRGVWLDEMDAR